MKTRLCKFLVVGLGLCLTLTLNALLFNQLQAATIFDANFDNSPFVTALTSNAVTAVSDLGTPNVGTWAFNNLPVGRITVNSNSTDKAFAVGHNSGKGVPNMTEMADVGVTFGTLPDTEIADSGAGDVVKAVFAQPGRFSRPGEQTRIKFDWGSFGNSDSGRFKYAFVTGNDSSGRQVFELLYECDSTGSNIQIFARSATDSSTTLTAPNSGTPQGTAVITSMPDFDMNSIGLEPTNLISVTITLTNNQVTYGFDRGTLGSTLTFGLNSAATNITELRWSAIWRAYLDSTGQNEGYWLDNVNVAYNGNSSPVLAAITNRTLIAGQVLTVTNSATDPDVPPQVLSWSVQPSLAGLSITTNGILQWRPTIAQSPSRNLLQVIVADNGTPSLSATQQFQVVVQRPVSPLLGAAVDGAGKFNLTLAGDVGPDYTVQTSPDLFNWLPLVTVTPTSLPLTLQWPVSNNIPQKFFRVQLGP